MNQSWCFFATVSMFLTFSHRTDSSVCLGGWVVRYRPLAGLAWPGSWFFEYCCYNQSLTPTLTPMLTLALTPMARAREVLSLAAPAAVKATKQASFKALFTPSATEKENANKCMYQPYFAFIWFQLKISYSSRKGYHAIHKQHVIK